ncbi:MAG: alpha-galactosidase [Fimbriimonadaceae bacterium]|nr:alpha-galactosidase [Fimbriimonadaceae bacterium]
MARIAMIGAGSQVFCKTLSMDIFATPALAGSEIRLMSRTRPKLDRMAAYLQRVVADNGLDFQISSTLDRREAIRDADYVICMVQVGGLDAYSLDYQIPLKYGVDQCIGDSLGPGGVFRGLRTIPVLGDLVRDMEELCPQALLLNYTNPMAACCLALGRCSQQVQFIGLCHGVQTTLDLIAGYLTRPKEQIDFLCAGINHMGWFLELHDKLTGEDLYPQLRACFERPEYYANEKVRGEVLRQFGYFMTESTGHLSEYIPWFRSSQRALDLYCDEPSFGGESGAYFKYCHLLDTKYRDVDYLASEDSTVGRRSVEYCSYILEAHQTDRVFRLNGNVRNDGYLTNLPAGCCVEVPVYVDRLGLHPARVGALPPQLAALNQSNVTVQTLAVEAGLTGDPEHIVHAIALDPLTSACCTLAEIRAMCAELLEAQREWLPQFAGQTLKATPVISIPPDTQRVDVPLDPALAIVHRFGELASRQV